MKNSIFCKVFLIISLLSVFSGRQAAAQYSTEGYTEIAGSGWQNSINTDGGINKFIIKQGTSWNAGVTINNNETIYLIVEGTATFSWISAKNKSNFHVIIGETGTVTNYATLNYTSGTLIVLNYSNAFVLPDNIVVTGTLENYGTVTTSGFQINDTFINHGTLTASGTLKTNTNSSLTNEGTINAASMETDSEVFNNGVINLSGNLKINSKSVVTNSARIIAAGNFTLDKELIMKEHAYLEIQQTTTLYRGTRLVFEKDAYIKTNNLTAWGDVDVDGPSEGHGLVQYYGTLTGEMPPFNPNNVYFVDGYGVEDLDGDGEGDGDDPIDFSISTTEFNPGYQSAPDSDGDGIPDEDDQFPDDPDLAYITYFPAEDSWNTLLFEDLWPTLGDYDFNDLVVKYRYELHVGTNNKVFKLSAQFKVLAAGADYANGFGFMLDIPNASVESVTGYVHSGSAIQMNANGTEQGASDEAVIIVYDDLSTSLGSMFNVRRNGTTKSVPAITVDVRLNEVDPDQLTDINPFLFIDQERGKEVHVMNKRPTSKASASYFGTNDDNSYASMYYRSKEGYPWGLDLNHSLSHMLETIDFTIGYPVFKNWVESGGTQYLDWYQTNVYSPALY